MAVRLPDAEPDEVGEPLEVPADLVELFEVLEWLEAVGDDDG